MVLRIAVACCAFLFATVSTTAAGTPPKKMNILCVCAHPDVIFTHAPDDESPDHWATSKIVRAMILSLPGINLHESPGSF